MEYRNRNTFRKNYHTAGGNLTDAYNSVNSSVDEQGAFHLLNMSTSTVDVNLSPTEKPLDNTGFKDVKKLTFNEQAYPTMHKTTAIPNTTKHVSKPFKMPKIKPVMGKW